MNGTGMAGMEGSTFETALEEVLGERTAVGQNCVVCQYAGRTQVERARLGRGSSYEVLARALLKVGAPGTDRFPNEYALKNHVMMRHFTQHPPQEG